MQSGSPRQQRAAIGNALGGSWRLPRGGEGGNPGEAFAKGGDSDELRGARLSSPVAIVQSLD